MRFLTSYLYYRRLRRAREAYAYWKGRREAMERLGNIHLYVYHDVYINVCGNEAMHEERLESLLREPRP